MVLHDDVIKWKHFPRNWPFVRGIHRSPVNSPHKGQWRGALMFSLICVWIKDWVNNREAGDFRRYRAHFDVIVMFASSQTTYSWNKRLSFRTGPHRKISDVFWLQGLIQHLINCLAIKSCRASKQWDFCLTQCGQHLWSEKRSLSLPKSYDVLSVTLIIMSEVRNYS